MEMMLSVFAGFGAVWVTVLLAAGVLVALGRAEVSRRPLKGRWSGSDKAALNGGPRAIRPRR
jgi:hypothetical protein